MEDPKHIPRTVFLSGGKRFLFLRRNRSVSVVFVGCSDGEVGVIHGLQCILGNNTEHVHRNHQKVGSFFFSIALVSIRYIPPKMTTNKIAPIQMVCFFCATFFSLVYTYTLSYSYLRLCFYSLCVRYSSSLCLAFSSYFSFLRTTLSSAFLFSNSAQPILAFSSPARMASIVCPFLLRREVSHPKFLPAASNFIVMVWNPLSTASCRAVLPSLFCALKKNCLSRGVSTGSFANLSRTASTQSPLLALTASMRHVLSWSSLVVYLTPCCMRKWKLSGSGAERERFKQDAQMGMRSLGSICSTNFFRISGLVCSLRAKQSTVSPLLFLFRGSAFSSSSLVTIRGSLSLTAISKGDSPSLVGKSRSLPGNLEKRATACSSSPSMARWRRDFPVLGSSSLRLGFYEWRIQASFQSQPLRSSLTREGNLLIYIIIQSTVVTAWNEGECHFYKDKYRQRWNSSIFPVFPCLLLFFHCMLYSSFGPIIMNTEAPKTRPFPPGLMQHRSTTELLPRSRSQALKAKRSLARSKLNLIARQLYDLKYDHEWQQAQLQQLTTRSYSIEKQAEEGMRRVKQVEAIAAGLAELHLGSFGKEEGMGSERSTQPERDDRQEESISTEKGIIPCCQGGTGLTYAEQTSASLLNNLKSSQSSSRYKPTPDKERKMSLCKQGKQKKGVSKNGIHSKPLGNIILFTLLLFVVCLLL